MYIFAEKAVPLPSSVDEYQVDVAYASVPPDDLLNKGITTMEKTETSQLNYWFRQLCEIITDLSEMGIASLYPALFVAENPAENDLKRDSANPNRLMIFKGSLWRELAAEASETEPGFIDPDRIFKSDNVFDLIPTSTRDTPGAMRAADLMTKAEFLAYNEYSVVESSGDIEDDNDFGESRYFSSEDTVIRMSPGRESSRFFLKHIFVNPSRTKIAVTPRGFEREERTDAPGSDLWISSDGNIFG
jgi:hypothetical protein